MRFAFAVRQINSCVDEGGFQIAIVPSAFVLHVRQLCVDAFREVEARRSSAAPLALLSIMSKCGAVRRKADRPEVAVTQSNAHCSVAVVVLVLREPRVLS